MEPRWELCIDCLDPLALAPFWEALLGYRRTHQALSGPYLELAHPEGRGQVILLQKVPEPKQVKNRLHLDLYSTDAEALLARAVELGATVQGERMPESDGSGWFQVLTDPAGNEFCVCTERP